MSEFLEGKTKQAHLLELSRSTRYTLLYQAIQTPTLLALRKNRRMAPASRFWFVLLLLAAVAPARAEAPKKIDFAHDIVPILKARCAECHTNGKYKGSLSLDTRADLLKSKAVVP